ncbi:unnamed protein product [Discosporangium mesarthrocarpum]
MVESLAANRGPDTVDEIFVPSSSIEFCGGTHISNTREAGAFVITEETAVAKGIRRVTAVTGTLAQEALAVGEDLKRKAAAAIGGGEGGAPREEREKAATELRRELDEASISAVLKSQLRVDMDKLLKKLASEAKAAAAAAAEKGVRAAGKAAKEAAAKGQQVLVMEVDIGADSKAVKRVLDAVTREAPGLSFMGFSAEGPGPSGKLLVFNSVAGPEMEGGLKADEWLKAALEPCGGRGGGRPTSAQGQAQDASGMGAAIDAARAFVS